MTVELKRKFEDMNWFDTFKDEVSRLLVGGGFPPINISVTVDNYLVRAELPGIDLSDIDLTISERSLSIRGKRSLEYPDGALLFHRERDDGFFSRTIALPKGLDSAKADASYANGILTVSFPKSEVVQPKQIEVKTGK
jgi:HSP20 family protein